MKTSRNAISVSVIAVIFVLLLLPTPALWAVDDKALELTDADYSKERIAELTLLLDAKSAQERAEGAEKLCMLGAEARVAIPKMLTLLNDQEGYVLYLNRFQVGKVVMQNLIELSPESLLPLQQRFPDLTKETRLELALRIPKAGTNARVMLPELIQMFESTKGDQSSRPLMLLMIATIDPNGKQAFQRVLKVLKHDGNASMRKYAAISLSRAKSARQVYWNQPGPAARWFRESPKDAIEAGDALLVALDDTEPDVRAAAAQSLVTYPESEERAMAGISKLLGDEKSYSVMYSNHFGGAELVSNTARWCLLELHSQADRVLQIIIQQEGQHNALKDRDIAELIPYCQQPLEALQTLLDGEHPELTFRALSQLGSGATKLAARLDRLTHHKNKMIADGAKSTLGQIAPKQYPGFVDQLKKPVAKLDEAISVAGFARPNVSIEIPRLLNRIQDDYDLKMDVVKELAAIGPEAIEAVPIIIDSFETGFTFYVDNKQDLLLKFGPGVVPLIITALISPEKKATLRVACLQVLPRFGEPAREAVPIIVEHLKSKYPRVRQAAARALGLLAAVPDQTLPRLQQALSDPRPFVRAAAAESCGAFGLAAAPQVPDLILLLSDEYLEVRLAAISALGKLGPIAIGADAKIKAQLVDKDVLVRDACKAALLAIRKAN
ncbi:MAG: repeat-containing protein [Planctomycetaceae bacterium]|nr:repeat-containing protein [Planctomycetaceae bacterium]